MKRLLICTIAICAVCTTAHAQSWLSALKKVATEAIDSATGGKLTEVAINGTWSYSAPAIRLGDSSNTLAKLGGQAISTAAGDKMASMLEKIGIKSGACSITFNSDGTFSMPIGSRNITGTYTFDNETHAIKLKIGYLGTEVGGYAYISGDSLQLVFNIDKFKDFIVSLGSSIESLASVIAIVQEYDNISLGLEFKK